MCKAFPYVLNLLVTRTSSIVSPGMPLVSVGIFLLQGSFIIPLIPFPQVATKAPRCDVYAVAPGSVVMGITLQADNSGQIIPIYVATQVRALTVNPPPLQD